MHAYSACHCSSRDFKEMVELIQPSYMYALLKPIVYLYPIPKHPTASKYNAGGVFLAANQA